MKITNNKILITGGASGIGLGLTERFLRENNTVIVCGRRESLLKDLAVKYPEIITRKCDLSVKEEREALYLWITESHPGLNVLVNNAGIQQWMKITDANFWKRTKEELTINIEAPLHLTSLFIQLKSMQTILNITSGLSFVPLVKVPVYSASKAFFHSFTISLRELLKPNGIEVIEIIPPALNTDLGGKGIHDNAPAVSEFIDAVFEQLKTEKQTITFGFSESIVNAGHVELEKTFLRMNSNQG